MIDSIGLFFGAKFREGEGEDPSNIGLFKSAGLSTRTHTRAPFECYFSYQKLQNLQSLRIVATSYYTLECVQNAVYLLKTSTKRCNLMLHTLICKWVTCDRTNSHLNPKIRIHWSTLDVVRQKYVFEEGPHLKSATLNPYRTSIFCCFYFHF